MLKKIAIVVFAASVSLPLYGCVTNGNAGAGTKLPKAPAYYMSCFNKLTDIPAGTLTRQDVVRLVAKLRNSELAKTRCGKDLLAWYDQVRTSFAR